MENWLSQITSFCKQNGIKISSDQVSLRINTESITFQVFLFRSFLIGGKMFQGFFSRNCLNSYLGSVCVVVGCFTVFQLAECRAHHKV